MEYLPLDDKLKDIFSIVNDWLKFAEAKAATLIAANAGLIFGVSRLISTFEIKGILLAYLLLTITLCALSLAICLFSFIPALDMPWEKKPSGTNESDNLLFFGHIAKYTPSAYLEKLATSLGLSNMEFNGFHKNLSDQIIINSVIANKKYNYFKNSIWLTLAALASPVVALIILWMKKNK